MALYKKDYEAAARIVATHYGATRVPHMNSCSFSPVSGAGCTCGAQEMVNQAKAVEDAFVAFFKQAGGQFNEERFRDACHNVRGTGKEVV